MSESSPVRSDPIASAVEVNALALRGDELITMNPLLPARGEIAPALFRELARVWGRLRGPWTSLAIIPADHDLSTGPLAVELSRVGSLVSGIPVDCLVPSSVDGEKASWLVGHLSSDVRDASRRTIVALENPANAPAVLPVALAADGIVLCVQKAFTPRSAIREAADLVGRDRIACCVVLA